MASFTDLLDEALEAWSYTRAGVIDELRNLGIRGLAFRPHPLSRSAAELARHVVESGRLMAGELSRPDGDFRRKSYPALLREHGGGSGGRDTMADLVNLLRSSHRDGEKRLRRAGELHMLQQIRRFDGKMGTRLAWLNHGISHEEYHRGQLAMYARLMGRVPALTKRILGQ